MRAMDGQEHRVFILATSIVPLISVVGAMILLWNHVIGPVDLAVFGLMATVTGLGITVGFHRLLTHRSFKTSRPMKIALTTCGAIFIGLDEIGRAHV